jgi:hypothetical protein
VLDELLTPNPIANPPPVRQTKACPLSKSTALVHPPVVHVPTPPDIVNPALKVGVAEKVVVLEKVQFPVIISFSDLRA